jgi:hypothetical protein
MQMVLELDCIIAGMEPRTGGIWRISEDGGDHQETTNVEVSGRFAAIHLERECPGLRFHTTTATSAVAAIRRPSR